MGKVLPFRGSEQSETQEPEKRIEKGDLRHAYKLRCMCCEWEGWVPAIQNCPRCGKGQMELLHEQELDYARI